MPLLAGQNQWERRLRSQQMPAFGTYQTKLAGQSMSALPGYSDINLFCYRQGVIHFNTEVSDGAFDLGVAEEKLHRPRP